MCIINHTHRFVFVHVPKNAGTSVSQLLSAVSGYRDLELGVHRETRQADGLYRERFGLGKHSPAAQIRRVMGAEEFAAYTVIGVARDPVDRVRSLFHFMQRWQAWTELDRFQDHAADFLATEDINDFVRSDFFATDGPGHLFMPQANWLCDRDGRELLVDALLRYETLEQDVATLPEVLGLPEEALAEALPRVNVSGSEAAPPFDDASLEIIRRRYAGDFAILGYEPPPGS